MGWNYLSIPKLPRLRRWSLWMDKWFLPPHYNGCNYLSMLGLKLNHVQGLLASKTNRCSAVNLLLDATIYSHMAFAIYTISETHHLKLKSHETSFIHNTDCTFAMVLKFCTEYGTKLLCTACKKIGQLKNKSWTNEISQGFSLRWFSVGYSLLQLSPVAHFNKKVNPKW